MFCRQRLVFSKWKTKQLVSGLSFWLENETKDVVLTFQKTKQNKTTDKAEMAFYDFFLNTKKHIFYKIKFFFLYA